MRKIKVFFKQLFLSILYLTRIKEFRRADISFGINKGKKAMVFGNAPSLKLLIEKYHKKEIDIPKDTFFVNYSPLDDFFYEIKPTHLFISDYCFDREGDHTDMNKKMYGYLQNRVDWDLTIYISRNNKRECQHLVDYMSISNQNIHFRFIYKRNCDDFEPVLRNKFYKTGFFLPVEHTIVSTALWTAILEGYSEVELYGIDTDQFKSLEVSDDNVLYIVDRHFNSEGKRYKVKSDTDERPYKIHEFLSVYAGMLKSYCILSDFAKYMGTMVYNCSPGSAVDAFERKKTI